MSVLTYLTQAIVDDNKTELDGKTLGRPQLLVGDGNYTVYVVDVDIGKGEPLRNVEVARNNYEVRYADTGAAVRLRRTESGRYQITGFSREMPGTLTRLPVNLDDFTFGEVQDLTITSRPLTYGELATYGGYGRIPYGAIAVFKGSELVEIIT